MGHIKNYYAILDIPEDATEDALKSAYRQIALKHHPDKNHDEKSIKLYNDAKEAYEVLKDPLKREDYDEQRLNLIRFARKNSARVRQGTNINIILKVSPDEVVSEITKHIQTQCQSPCPLCDGTGSSKKKMIICPKCNGTGIDVVSSVIGPKKFCAECKGYGNVSERPPCKRCQGTGLFSMTITRPVKLSRDTQARIVIPGSGNYPQGPGIRGDMIVTLDIEKKSLYKINGKNVEGDLVISPAQAVLGDTIFMDVFDNVVKIIIPAGTTHGTVLKKENAGIGKGDKKGNLILKVSIAIPEKISGEERDLYLKLLKIQKGFL